MDRTADIDEAAKALVTARFGFRGSAVYAPDVVLVNEFVKTRLLKAITQHAASLLMDSQSPSEKSQQQDRSASTRRKQFLAEFADDDSARLIVSGAQGAVVEVLSR